MQRVDRESNLIQINKMDWVYALGLAASNLETLETRIEENGEETTLEPRIRHLSTSDGKFFR